MSGAIPAFTILDDAIDNEPLAREQQEPGMPTWQAMYESNLTSAPPNSPLFEYNMPNMVGDYPMPQFGARTPQIPQAYTDSLHANIGVSKRNLRFNLPAVPPEPLPSYPPVPYYTPPYGMPYPSDGFSQFDGSLAMNAGVSQFVGGPGVPAASWPALQDGRDSPSMPMTPYLLGFVEKTFKEGYKAGREDYVPSCQDNFHHSLSCPICSAASIQTTRLYQGGLIFLGLMVLALLIILFRHK